MSTTSTTKQKKPFKSKSSSSTLSSILPTNTSSTTNTTIITKNSNNTTTTSNINTFTTNILFNNLNNIQKKNTTNTASTINIQSSTSPIEKFLTSFGLEDYPSSLLVFCKKAFEQCKSERDTKFIQQFIISLIKPHIGKDTLYTMDWENNPIPKLPSHWNTTESALKSTFISSPNLLFSSTTNNNNNNSDNNTKTLLNLPKIPKKRSESSLGILTTNHLLQHIKKKKKKMTHHNTNESTSSLFKPLIGTKMELEKEYLRLTSQVQPEDIRPLPILKKAFPFILEKYKKEKLSYQEYLCEQLKAIRQDLTVQRIENEFTILVYETHARIALQNKDLSEFSQCQTRLKDLYSKENNLLNKKNENEFIMYQIIYLTFIGNDIELNRILKNIKDFKNKYINYAMNIYKNIKLFNFYKIFNEYYFKAPCLSKFIM
ncbi:hypothetical protein ABK040_008666 [Willaertia magna]